MAGGEGTRLRPLTSLRPKPMVPIFNQPVMEHIVGLVRHHGINEIVATLAFMPQFIEDYFGGGEEWGMSMSYALEETPLGTAGSVKNAQALIGDETFLVISGDALTDIDLTEVIRFHKERGAAVTIALKSVPDPLDFGVVITDAEGKIERFLEKPSWGQVFSDTINTGIYVIEPEVLDHIPDDRAYDFSSELFPRLMEMGYELYGYPCDGYWCDVGSPESYVQAHRDVFNGMAKLFIPGVQAREGLWVGEGSEVDPGAEIGTGVLIGRNVTVRAGARIGDYTVLGDNCVVGNDASITHSILWSDAFVGKNASVSGAVLCRRVDVRASASVAMGAVIGDEVMIGKGANVGTDVQIYPYKRVEPAAMVRESLIWESTGVRSLFGDFGISGIVGVDISPELALRAAQAFGSLLPKGSHVIVSRDSSRASRMVKRAMVAGLNSAGCNVRDLRVASPAINRLTTRDTRCVGGVHVCQSPSDPQALEIGFFDKTGLDIAPWEEKKIERLYFRGEFRRAFFSEVGDIIYPPRAIEYYGTGLEQALAVQSYSERGQKAVVDVANGVASVILPQVASAWHVDLVMLNPFMDAERSTAMVGGAEEDYSQLLHSLGMFQADFGVRFDSSGERLRLVTSSGRLLDGDEALYAMVDLWCRTDAKGLPVAVPMAASRIVEQIAKSHGRSVLRPGRSRRSMAALAIKGDIGFAGGLSGGYMFADFLAGYDAVMSLGSLSRMLATDGRTLDQVVESLPVFHTSEIDVFCPVGKKGAVMRTVTEATVGLQVDMTEGIRADVDGGWMLVMPHSSEPLVKLYVEGDNEEDLERIAEHWVGVVQGAISGD